jgi:hypothetical protein
MNLRPTLPWSWKGLSEARRSKRFLNALEPPKTKPFATALFRGFLQSGVFGGKIVSIHQERAKRMVDQTIATAREQLSQAPQFATQENLKCLLASLYATIDRVFRSQPSHLRARGFDIKADSQRRSEHQIRMLKAHTNREIQILKREADVQLANRRRRHLHVIGQSLILLVSLLISILGSAAGVTASLNHGVLPYVLIFASALPFLVAALIIGRDIRHHARH